MKTVRSLALPAGTPRQEWKSVKRVTWKGTSTGVMRKTLSHPVPSLLGIIRFLSVPFGSARISLLDNSEYSSKNVNMVKKYLRYKDSTSKPIQDYFLNFFDPSNLGNVNCYPGETLRRVIVQEGLKPLEAMFAI